MIYDYDFEEMFLQDLVELATRYLFRGSYRHFTDMTLLDYQDFIFILNIKRKNLETLSLVELNGELYTIRRWVQEFFQSKS